MTTRKNGPQEVWKEPFPSKSIDMNLQFRIKVVACEHAAPTLAQCQKHMPIGIRARELWTPDGQIFFKVRHHLWRDFNVIDVSLTPPRTDFKLVAFKVPSPSPIDPAEVDI